MLCVQQDGVVSRQDFEVFYEKRKREKEGTKQSCNCIGSVKKGGLVNKRDQ